MSPGVYSPSDMVTGLAVATCDKNPVITLVLIELFMAAPDPEALRFRAFGAGITPLLVSGVGINAIDHPFLVLELGIAVIALRQRSKPVRIRLGGGIRGDLREIGVCIDCHRNMRLCFNGL